MSTSATTTSQLPNRVRWIIQSLEAHLRLPVTKAAMEIYVANGSIGLDELACAIQNVKAARKNHKLDARLVARAREDYRKGRFLTTEQYVYEIRSRMAGCGT